MFLKFHISKYSSYLAVIGGFLVHISLGGIFTYGSMFPYIEQYLNFNHTKNKSINTLDTAWIIGMATFGRGTSMTLGAYIENRLGSTLTVLVGGLIMSFGYILTFFTIKFHIILISLSYGLVVGVGTGIAYGLAMTIPSEWFPDYRGFLSGIILSGFGIGSLGFDLVQAYFINNDILKITLDNPNKVPMSFILMGCVYLTMQFISAPLIKRPKVRAEMIIGEEDLNIFGESIQINIEPHQLIFFTKFWIVWITYALNSVFSMLFLLLHKKWGKVLGISDRRLLIATSVGGIFSIIGRIIWGYLTDKYGYKIVIWISTLSFAIMFSTFYLCSKVGDFNVQDDNHRYTMYLTWVIMIFFLISGNFSIFPAICVKTFGAKYYTGNFGVLFTGYSFSGLLTSILILKLFYDQNDLNEFLKIFLIGSSIAILSLIVSLFYDKYSQKNIFKMFLI